MQTTYVKLEVDKTELEAKIEELDEAVEKARSIMEDLASREFEIIVKPVIAKS